MMYLLSIAAARESILISASYFVPDDLSVENKQRAQLALLPRSRPTIGCVPLYDISNYAVSATEKIDAATPSCVECRQSKRLPRRRLPNVRRSRFHTAPIPNAQA
jgi:hypothetical protein